MKNTIKELEIRKNEATNLLIFLKYLNETFIPDVDCPYDSTTVSTSIKANIIMMLDNAVESTVGNCLEKVHEKIKSEKLKYNDLSDELKKLIAVYYGYSIEKASDIDKTMDHVLKFADFVNGNIDFVISYSELSEKHQLYSGNLDTREILNVLKKYGIVFEERCTELKTIKDYRNKLAHGEESFEEVGRTLTVQRLEALSNRTFEYLEKLICAIDEYLNEEKFKRQI